MLPEPHDFPAPLPQPAEIARIPPAVACDLGLPSRGELVAPFLKAPAVPKVAVHEYDELDFPHYEIRSAGQIPNVRLEGKAEDGETGRNDSLGAGVTTPNARHDPTSRLGRHDIPTMPSRRLRWGLGGQIGFGGRTHRHSALLVGNPV
jgi:hypothetical protein